MCGICGFITKESISMKELEQMNNTMYHRGPDDHGEEIYTLDNEYNLGFAQRRLSIMDLSMLGHQPMHSKDKRISVVYNGEIYNFKEIKKELPEYTFLSECDTEVIIAGYLKWGIDCINRFQGMFAIALYDRETQELFLVRDRIGKKPLYYWKQKENLVFASELKPIMQYPGFPFQIRQELLGRYLFQQYLAEPDTIFRNVYKLEPGTILCFKNGIAQIKKYWDIVSVYQKESEKSVENYEEAKQELKKRLVDSVQHRMISDVPLGTFLSGGYDSTLITAIASGLSKEPVKTFTIGFHDTEYNEAEHAKEIATYLGTEHTELYISEEQMLDMVESLPEYFDEPFADSSQIPSMLVAKLAREKVTVALSGDGGDEFFCGYGIYDSVALAQKLNPSGFILSKLFTLPGIRQSGVIEKLPFKIRTIVKNRDKNTQTQLSSDHTKSIITKILANEQEPFEYQIEEQIPVKNWQIRRMLLDMKKYLPGDILCKVDRASMKYSLESRCPILDTSVMEYSFRIPHRYKYNKNTKKYILKDIAHDYVPKEMLERPKSGFSVPMNRWLRGPLREKLLELSDKQFLETQKLFNPEETKKFINQYLEQGDKGSGSGENYSRLVWAYYVFQSWYLKYCR